MANCHNNMYYTRRRSLTPSPAPCNTTPSAMERFSTVSACPCKMDGCPDTRDFFPSDVPLAMAYVPWQNWSDLYEPCKALSCGTLFSELNKPFLGKGGRHR